MRRAISLTILLAALMLAGSIMFVRAPRSDAATSGKLTGYAWSDTIGWIDMNCANSNSCGTNNFGISVDSNGNLSGYAWSDNIGWISANQADLLGCPSGTCKAKIDSSTNKMTGWLRALSHADGWDGWISLSGSSPSYGPTFSNSTGAITGYGWGSDVVGWVDFSLVTTDYRTCTPGTTYSCIDTTTLQATTLDTSCNATYANTTCTYICSTGACVPPPAPQFSSVGNGGHLSVHPSVVRAGATTRVSWDVLYVTSCTVSGGGDSWSGAAAGCNSSTHECSSGSPGMQSSAITDHRVYTLSCTGLDNSTITEQQSVDTVPTYQEI